MGNERSFGRDWGTNLLIFLAWLFFSGLLFTGVAWLFLGFATAAKIGGCVAIVVASAITIWEFTCKQRDERYIKNQCRSLEEALHDERVRLQKAEKFIAEFLGLESVNARMEVLQRAYHERIRHAQEILRLGVSRSLPDSIASLNNTIGALGVAMRSAEIAEERLCVAYELACCRGFSLKPIKEYLKMSTSDE